MTNILTAVRPASDRARALLDAPQDARMLIGGEWVYASDGATLASIDPATGQVIGHIPDATDDDVDTAVRAARKAFAVWSQTPPAERANILWRIAELIDANIDELAEMETLDQGKPLYVGRWAEIPGAAGQFRFFAGQATAIEGRTITPSITYQPAGKQVHAWTLREPVGVVAAIVPWNSPLVLTAMKLAPALAAGCTVVLKPAEDTSLTALRLAELMVEAGLPEGVLNVVTGRGAQSGAALASYPGVDKVAFTGSTATGRAILDASKGNLKRVTLELGGKSPVIVLPDADLDLAIPGAANAIFFNGGQVCVAGSRAYVHASIYDSVIEGLSAYADGLQLGHGLNPATQMGPMVSTRQAERVADFVAGAKIAGASIVTGGDTQRRRRHLHPPDRDCRRLAKHGRRARGDFRAGAGGATLRRSRRGGRSGQRQRLRPRRQRLDRVPLVRSPAVTAHPGRHGVDQLPPDVRRQPADRRRQAIGLWPRQRHRRARQLSRMEDRLRGALIAAAR